MSTLQDLFNKAKGVQETSLWDLCAAAGYTTDRRYRPGEISEKTGLQKQPDGSWKEPQHRTHSKRLKSETKTTPAIHHEALNEKQVKQTKEIETRINKSGWFKTQTTLDGVHPEAAKDIEIECKKIFEEYPMLKGFIEGIKTADFINEETNALTMVEGTGESAFIVLNTKYYSSNETLHQVYSSQVEAKYHPEGTTAESLIIHEIGHCITDFVAQKRGQDFDAFCRELVELVKTEFENAGYTIDFGSDLSFYCTDAAACPTDEIQNAEIIAEAFAEYKNSKNPRAIANFIGNLLTGELE